MRLNQFLAHNAGVSRREADALIAKGRVSIGRKVAVLGDSVSPGERVFLDGKEVRQKRSYTVVVYNKPRGEIVSKSSAQGRTIYESLGKKFSAFSAVGRLDKASEGVLVLSDSKAVVKHLMESNLEREYILKASGETKQSVLAKIIAAMENGLSLTDARAGGHAKSEIISMDFAPFIRHEITKFENNTLRAKVIINEGKNRELRRFFAHFGFTITYLKRVRFGFVSLNNLPTAKSRYLTKDEYKALHAFLES